MRCQKKEAKMQKWGKWYWIENKYNKMKAHENQLWTRIDAIVSRFGSCFLVKYKKTKNKKQALALHTQSLIQN